MNSYTHTTLTTTEFHNELIGLQDCLMRFAYSLTADNEDAKDLLQSTNLKALTYCDQFKDNTSLKAWTFTIMKNTFINIYRKAIKQKTSFGINDNQFMMSILSENNGPDSQYSHNEISVNIEELDDNFRIPFQMHTSGYKYKEIAEKLNLNLGTVKSRIFHSRKKLMSQLSR